jgi:serine/threonine protein phosphatase PrpC
MTNMTADLETAFFTAAGGARNQDRAAVFTRPWGTVIVVADGAGGTAGGELAAESAIDHLANVSARSSLPLDEAQFVDALESIDARLLRSAHGGANHLRGRSSGTRRGHGSLRRRLWRLAGVPARHS